jgi:ribose transport system substrate-binding protein
MLFSSGEKEAAGADDISIAQVAWGLDDIFFQTVQDGTRYEMNRLSAENGYAYSRDLKGSNEPDAQVQISETMLAKDPDYFIFCTVDSNLIGPVLEYNQNDIPVFTNNVAVLGGKHNFVAFDNFEAGRQSARSMVELFEDRYGLDPKTWAAAGGKIIELTGDLGMSIALERSGGFHEILDPIVKATPGLEIITVEGKWSADIAFTRMSDMITKYGSDIIGTFTHGDTMSIAGVWPALSSYGMGFTSDQKGHVVMVAIDGTSAALQMVREKKIDSITIQPAWGEGVVIARLIDQLKQGNALPDVGEVLYDDETMPLIMTLVPDQFTSAELEAGAKPVWAPVNVVEGTVPNGSWDGVWYKTNSNMTCPGDYPADSKLLWGNFWLYLRDGVWPWE